LQRTCSCGANVLGLRVILRLKTAVQTISASQQPGFRMERHYWPDSLLYGREAPGMFRMY
jgi:hypothetical protein